MTPIIKSKTGATLLRLVTAGVGKTDDSELRVGGRTRCYCSTQPAQQQYTTGPQNTGALQTNLTTARSDVWLTVHRNSVWIRKTN